MPVKVGFNHIAIWDEYMEPQIQEYEQEPIEKGKIVFYGPSYFTRWSAKRGFIPLADSLPGASGAKCCINRGFGSSCAEQQLYYYPRTIRPLEPAVLVYQPGYGNGAAFGYTAEEQFELVQRVVAYTLHDFPEAKVYLIGVNLGRDKRESAARFDNYLKEFAAATDRVIYGDLTAFGKLNSDQFYVEDKVHYNQKGYDLFAEFFRDLLRDELAKF